MVTVDVDMKVVTGFGRLRHEQALEIAEAAKVVMYEGRASALRFSSSGSSNSTERRCLAEAAGGFPGRKT